MRWRSRFRTRKAGRRPRLRLVASVYDEHASRLASDEPQQSLLAGRADPSTRAAPLGVSAAAHAAASRGSGPASCQPRAARSRRSSRVRTGRTPRLRPHPRPTRARERARRHASPTAGDAATAREDTPGARRVMRARLSPCTDHGRRRARRGSRGQHWAGSSRRSTPARVATPVVRRLLQGHYVALSE
jgi:hypothetical protein